MLMSYQGIVEGGRVRLVDVILPEGAEVVVVSLTLPTVASQQQHLAALTDEEWRRPFSALALTDEESVESDVSTISDEELNAIVHASRSTQA